MSIWANSYANMINGSDGTIFSPFVEKKPIYLYNSELCRSLYLDYNETITIEDGIEVMGFKPTDYFFQDYKHNPENAGFCTPPGNCLPAGVLNLSECVNQPVIMSSPHFLFGDPKFLNDIEGLKPDSSKHITQLYLEPMSGVPMIANKRLQFNTLLRKDNNIP